MRIKKCYWPKCHAVGCTNRECKADEFAAENERMDKRFVEGVLLSIALTIALAAIIGFILIIWPV